MDWGASKKIKKKKNCIRVPNWNQQQIPFAVIVFLSYCQQAVLAHFYKAIYVHSLSNCIVGHSYNFFTWRIIFLTSSVFLTLYHCVHCKRGVVAFCRWTVLTVLSTPFTLGETWQKTVETLIIKYYDVQSKTLCLWRIERGSWIPVPESYNPTDCRCYPAPTHLNQMKC